MKESLIEAMGGGLPKPPGHHGLRRVTISGGPTEHISGVKELNGWLHPEFGISANGGLLVELDTGSFELCSPGFVHVCDPYAQPMPPD